MITTTTDRAAFLGLSRAKLREIANAADQPGLDGRAFYEFGRQKLAAREVLRAMDEERLERLASEQLKGLMAGDRASFDHDGLALEALSLAKSLAAALDADAIEG